MANLGKSVGTTRPVLPDRSGVLTGNVWVESATEASQADTVPSPAPMAQ